MKEDKPKKGGRPHGSKSKVNLPARSIENSIEWSRKIYENAKYNEFHPDDLPDYIGIGRGFASPALSILDKYGLIERGTIGWHISQLGKGAIRGNGSSIKECLERIDLYRELLSVFGDKKVNKSIIIAHLKSKYKYGNNTELIADKFIESKDYLDSFENCNIQTVSPKESSQGAPPTGFKDEDLVVLLKLKYAFQPIDESSKIEILNDAYKHLSKSGDPAVESIIEEIKKNERNDNVRDALINALISTFEKKYPILGNPKILKPKETSKIKEKTDSKEVESEKVDIN